MLVTFCQFFHSFLVGTLDSCQLPIKLLAEELLKFLFFVCHGLLVLLLVDIPLSTQSLNLTISRFDLQLELFSQFIKICDSFLQSVQFRFCLVRLMVSLGPKLFHFASLLLGTPLKLFNLMS